MMKRAGWHLPLALAAFCMVIFAGQNAFAVHKDAGMVCSGCHSMHYTLDGASLGAGPYDYLLRIDNTNDGLCLDCHDNGNPGYAITNSPIVSNSGVAVPAADYAAGGDFNDNAAGAGSNVDNGHNLGNALTPAGSAGGAIDFHCTTCHDAHGVANGASTAAINDYRNLLTDVADGAPATGATTALDNSTEDTDMTPSDTYRRGDTSYGNAGTGPSNLSEWCGACHDGFYPGTNGAAAWQTHPTNINMAAAAADWANYNAAGNADPLPLEDTLGSASQNATHEGDENTDGVFCLSCHFAHAGPNADGLRWNNSIGLGQFDGCNQCHNK